LRLADDGDPNIVIARWSPMRRGGPVFSASLSTRDRRIRDSVVQQFDWDPEIDARNVGVVVSEGAVTLTGVVTSWSGKLAAERAAKRVHGVRAVANDIEVRPLLKRTDAEIAVETARALSERDSVPESVQAAVHEGYVSLSGTVQTLFQKRAAEEAVRHVRGVRHVANFITVAPKPVVRDVQHRIMKALHHNADIDARHVRVDIAGDIATLTGSVASWLQAESAERAAADAPGIREVVNHLTVDSSRADDDAEEIC
jgi:osmotically-inducible protein OsmY